MVSSNALCIYVHSEVIKIYQSLGPHRITFVTRPNNPASGNPWTRTVPVLRSSTACKTKKLNDFIAMVGKCKHFELAKHPAPSALIDRNNGGRRCQNPSLMTTVALEGVRIHLTWNARVASHTTTWVRRASLAVQRHGICWVPLLQNVAPAKHHKRDCNWLRTLRCPRSEPGHNLEHEAAAVRRGSGAEGYGPQR